MVNVEKVCLRMITPSWHRCIALLLLGQQVEASSLLLKLVDNHPGFDQAVGVLVGTISKIGLGKMKSLNYGEALTLFNKAIQYSNERSVECLINRGGTS